MNLPNCICCDSQSWIKISLKDNPNYLRCSSCNYYIQEPTEEANIKNTFKVEQEKYYDESSIILSPVFSIIQKEISTRRLKIIKKYLHTDARLVEVGPGNGDLLKLLLNNNYKVDAIEESAVLASTLKKSLGINIMVGEFENQHIATNSYDSYLSFHVIEHLPDVIHHLKKAQNIVKVGGYAFIATPNADGWEHNMPFGLSPNYDTAHFQLFSIKSLCLCMEKSGWIVREVITPEYSTGWLRVFTKLMRTINSKETSIQGGEQIKRFDNKKNLFILLINLFSLISFPLRKFQESILKGNELLIVAQRKV